MKPKKPLALHKEGHNIRIRRRTISALKKLKEEHRHKTLDETIQWLVLSVEHRPETGLRRKIQKLLDQARVLEGAKD